MKRNVRASISDNSHAHAPARWKNADFVDHRHETERFVGPDGFDHLVADHHVDGAGLHDVHAVAGIAFVEHDAAGGTLMVAPALFANARISISARCFLPLLTFIPTPLEIPR